MTNDYLLLIVKTVALNTIYLVYCMEKWLIKLTGLYILNWIKVAIQSKDKGNDVPIHAIKPRVVEV
jgi:hypothetical protein